MWNHIALKKTLKDLRLSEIIFIFATKSDKLIMSNPLNAEITEEFLSTPFLFPQFLCFCEISFEKLATFGNIIYICIGLGEKS